MYAAALGAFLRERGLPPDALAHPVANTHPAAAPGVSTAAQRIDGHAYGNALVTATNELGDSALGLDFGTRVGAAGFGMLGIAAATAPTLRAAIGHLIELESITCTLGYVTMQHDRHQVRLCWRPAQPVPTSVIEGILAGWVSFGRYLLGEHVAVREVSFAHRRQASMDAYDTALDCPVRFDCDGYGVSIASDLLDAAPRFADAGLNTALTGWLGQCAAAVAPQAKTLTRHLSALLGAQVDFNTASEIRLAQHLDISPRALQRRLQQEGTSFRQVLDAARAQHAIIGLLRGGVTLADLAQEVGFDEQSSLCRAFRKWTGYAPLAFKQRMPEGFGPLRNAPTLVLAR
jgi:AraC-like DNA-binding protein